MVTRTLVAFNSHFSGGCPYVRQIPRISPPRKIWIFAQSRPGNPGQKHFGSGSLFFASSSSEVGRPTQETVTLTTPPAPAAGATAARQPLQRYPGFRPRPDTPGRLPDRRRPGPEPQPGRAGHRGRRASLRAFPAGFARVRPGQPPQPAGGSRARGNRPGRASGTPADCAQLDGLGGGRPGRGRPARTCGCATWQRPNGRIRVSVGALAGDRGQRGRIPAVRIPGRPPPAGRTGGRAARAAGRPGRRRIGTAE